MAEHSNDIRSIIRSALAEDIGPGDATSNRTLDEKREATGRIVAKQEGIVAGLSVVSAVFAELSSSVHFDANVHDGSRVSKGTVIGTVTGNARAILTGERTALNFLQRMSGIATTTRAFVEAVSGTGVEILDTRKTAPGMRLLDKLAVLSGGGKNHRFGLFDMILIKDNHIDACGGITEAVRRSRAGSPTLPIEVECRSVKDVTECLPLKVDRLLLDNMDVKTVQKAVKIAGGAVPLEVSGNISLDNVRAYAETGVQYISVGALTHSVKALDISMVLAT